MQVSIVINAELYGIWPEGAVSLDPVCLIKMVPRIKEGCSICSTNRKTTWLIALLSRSQGSSGATPRWYPCPMSATSGSCQGASSNRTNRPNSALCAQSIPQLAQDGPSQSPRTPENPCGAHGLHPERYVQTALRLAARRCSRQLLYAGGAAITASKQRLPVEAGDGSGGAKKWL